ncbi:hypothetical protein TRE132_34100 [Pseudomonas chlororaphis subsp. aurantiaca]|nr:nickel uptake transporter family protein [Pseudomonas chlororaphis]AZD92765.1 hypothetical protein C4K13_3348 [Pseudomonas chlororaphis subsp. aureofaciens]TSD25757.1 DUF4198 domain-containing protein [Pseudomonas sp. ATCC 13985]BBN55285.1 hypothetical protein TRE132_34100 [Pseudomonas chlororaphis subsp. aurantiaca]KAB0532328.1 DUF4198 domain-containing protein [Pseudomonas chlororaphis subsp. aureofaciens]
MRMSTANTLIGLGALMLASGTQAHQIWYEHTPGQPLTLYYGEYDKNMLEVTPGGLDRFRQLKGWSAANPLPAPALGLSLGLQRQSFSVGHQPRADESLLAQDSQYPLFDLHEGGKTLKTHWTPATRWVGDLRARQPELALDIVPTGVAAAGKAQFQVFYELKPLAAQEVILETGSGEVFTQTSDQDGKVSFALPWQGTYVVAAEYKDRTPGTRQGPDSQAEAYDLKSFSSTLSFHQPQGKPPLPRAPSTLPASEVARLKKQS